MRGVVSARAAGRGLTVLAMALALALSSGLAVAAPLGGSTVASAAAKKAKHSKKKAGSKTLAATHVVLGLPAPGDFSYGVAQVRIAHRAGRPGHPRGAVFSSNAGGLTLSAVAGRWGALRKSTRVYVVVSRVAHTRANVRNVYFFITRRRGGKTGPAHGAVSFTIANAAPAVGSFWVRGVNRRGIATVFEDVSALSTALHNWSRYLNVLKIAHALMAAAHPKDLTGLFRQTRATARVARAKDGVRGPGQGLWTAGARPTADVHKVFDLIFGTLGDPAAFGAAKESPLIPAFIGKDLNNGPLAKLWEQVMAVLPLQVPDTYAANAGEEAKFGKVRAPKISQAVVAIADSSNAGSQAAIDSPPSGSDSPSVGQRVNLHFVGTGRAVIYQMNQDSYGNWQPIASTAQGCSSDCSYFYPSGVRLEIDAGDLGSFHGWRGCNAGTAGGNSDNNNIAHICYVTIRSGSSMNVYGYFTAGSGATAALDISQPGTGAGQVTSSPAGLNCPGTCSANFPLNQKVTLTETAANGSYFGGWTGCDSVSADGCTVALSSDKTVGAVFLKNPTLTVTRAGNGTGTVTSSPSGINCGTACAASFPFGQSVVLTATPSGSGSRFAGWSGACSGTGTCSVSMTQARSVTAAFTSGSPGQLDSTFGTGGFALAPAGDPGSYAAQSLVRQPDGKYVVGGLQYDATSTSSVVRLARFNPDGSLDSTFGSGGIVTVPSSTFTPGGTYTNPQNAWLAYQPTTGDIIVAVELGNPSNVGGPGDVGVVRLSGANGSVDTAFAGGSGLATASPGGPGTDFVNAVLVDPTSGTIYVGGSGTPPGSTNGELALTAFTAGGLLEDGSGGTTAFGGGTSGSVLTPVSAGNATINALVFDGSNILASGTVYGASSTAVVMRYTPAGAPDASFNGGAPQTVAALNGGFGGSIAVDGNVIVVGGSTMSGSPSTDCIALGALNESDGSVDSGFSNPPLCLGQDAAVDGLAVGSGGEIYAAGYDYDGTSSHYVVAAYGPDGAPDTSFGSTASTPGYVSVDPGGTGTSGSAKAIVLDGSKIVVAGDDSSTSGTGSVNFALARFLG